MSKPRILNALFKVLLDEISWLDCTLPVSTKCCAELHEEGAMMVEDACDTCQALIYLGKAEEAYSKSRG